MKILVTGAGGYLGQGIVTALLNLGETVVATDLNVDLIDKRADRIACDLFSIESPYDFFKQPDVVLHLAWRDGFKHNSHSHLSDFPKHVDFLECIADSPVSRIAVMGSMHEVGYYEGAITEETPCFPQTYYGIAKNALREVTKLVCKTRMKKMQWLRAYYIVGTDIKGSSIFSKLMQAESRNEKYFPFTSGQSKYDFLDYDDFCMMVAACISQDDVLGIINICSGCPVALASRVERYISENKMNIKLEYGAYPDRPYDSKAIWGDPSKIKMILESVRNKNEI